MIIQLLSTISLKKLFRKKRISPVENQDEKSFYKKIKKLVEHHVLPHAQRSDVDSFRRNMKTEEMALVLKKHEGNLLSTFKKFQEDLI